MDEVDLVDEVDVSDSHPAGEGRYRRMRLCSCVSAVVSALERPSSLPKWLFSLEIGEVKIRAVEALGEKMGEAEVDGKSDDLFVFVA